MLLLWLGASISISEIYTGGLLAPLGFGRGMAVILAGHLIGTGLLAFGSWISFSRKENAMDSAVFSLGGIGGKLAALCNVVQLIGWTIVMVVQAARAVSGVFPGFPFPAAALILSGLVLLWALLLGSPAGRLNEIAVILLSVLCVLLFVEAAGKGRLVSGGGLHAAMSVSLGIELSIAMPVSWLPLAGDYASKTDSPAAASLMPFIGYFTGSVLMYGFGLYIAVSSGQDIFSFAAGSAFRFAACAVVVLSTMTTAFLDLYSAAVSSRQFLRPRNERLPVLAIGLFALAASVFFPIGTYEAFLTNFLTAIGMVFVPVYGVIFLDYILKRRRFEKPLKFSALAVIVIGMAAYRLFTQFEIWIPTVLTILTVWVLYLPFALPGLRKKGARRV
jgi:putative hydroxymethylpyrimidine transporter CytX